MVGSEVLFNPFDPGFSADPYSHYAALRTADPVHRTALGPWLLTRYSDVVAVLRDPTASVEAANATLTPMQEAMQAQLDELAGDRSRGSRAMLSLDPPDHDRLRRLVAKAFTPRTVEQLAPLCRRLVDDALDAAAVRGGLDVVADLAFPLPFTVISEMLGMPTDRREELREWSGALVKTLDPILTTEEFDAALAAGDAMTAYVQRVIDAKRAEPAGDLLSALIAAEDEGDMLDAQELIDQVILLYVAGHETTVNLIANGTLALLRNPEQADRLRADPTLDQNAVEELLRFDPPVQVSGRVAIARPAARRHDGPGGVVPADLARRREPGPGAVGTDRGRARPGSGGRRGPRRVRWGDPPLPRRRAGAPRGAHGDPGAVPPVPGSRPRDRRAGVQRTFRAAWSGRAARHPVRRRMMAKLDDIAAHLAAVPMFSQLAAKQRRHVAKALGVHEVADGVMLVRQGEAGDTFYVILDGTAKVVRNGRRIATLETGDWFGELALLDPAPRNADVVTVGPGTVGILDARSFRRLVAELPAMTARLLAGLARRVRDGDRRAVE